MGFKTYQEQIQDFQRLLQEDQALAYARYGFTMFNSIEPSLHLKEKQRLGRWEPQTDLDHFNLGVLASHEGNHKQAIVHYEKAVEINPDLEIAWNNLAWSYGALEKKTNQKAAIETLLDLIERKAGTASPSKMSDDEIEEIRETLAQIS